jgi:hypothetical protein
MRVEPIRLGYGIILSALDVREPSNYGIRVRGSKETRDFVAA